MPLKDAICAQFFNYRITHEVGLFELEYAYKEKAAATPQEVKAAMDELVAEGKFTVVMDDCLGDMYGGPHPFYSFVWPKMKDEPRE